MSSEPRDITVGIEESWREVEMVLLLVGGLKIKGAALWAYSFVVFRKQEIELNPVCKLVTEPDNDMEPEYEIEGK
jgi:hypothetical protein